MEEQADRESATQHQWHTGWFNWAARHSGVVLLGTLVVAILALTRSPNTHDDEPDPGNKEVPLFI